MHRLPEKFSSCFTVLYNTLNEAANESTGPNDLIEQLVYLVSALLPFRGPETGNRVDSHSMNKAGSWKSNLVGSSEV